MHHGVIETEGIRCLAAKERREHKDLKTEKLEDNRQEGHE
jgi:hypothetical protein